MIDEGGHRRQKNLVSETGHSFSVGELCGKRLPDRLWAREGLWILSTWKNEMPHPLQLLFSFLREISVSRGSRSLSPSHKAMSLFPCCSHTVLGGCGLLRASCASNLTVSKGTKTPCVWPLATSAPQWQSSALRPCKGELSLETMCGLQSLPDLSVDLFPKGK